MLNAANAFSRALWQAKWHLPLGRTPDAGQMFGPQMLGLLPRPIYDPRSTGGRQASVRMSGRKYKNGGRHASLPEFREALRPDGPHEGRVQARPPLEDRIYAGSLQVTRDPQQVFRHLVASGPKAPSPQDERTEPEAPSWPPSGCCLTEILLIVDATFQVPDFGHRAIHRLPADLDIHHQDYPLSVDYEVGLIQGAVAGSHMRFPLDGHP